MINMEEGNQKKHTGRCFDCGGILELVEMEIQGSTKIMKCLNCGLFHVYKKDFLGRHRLSRVTKNLETP
jgi:hypothetical protein